MKKFLLLALAAVAFTACSKDNDSESPFVVCPQAHIEVVSFEPSEQMVDFLGNPLAVGAISVVGGSATGTYQNVCWAGSDIFADYCTVSDAGVTSFNDLLFSTKDQNIWFGSYYSDNMYDQVRYDSWGGFALTANYGKTATAPDYRNQFTVWADKGALGSETCLVGYCDFWSGNYATPTIELIEPKTICHLYMANTSVTYLTEPSVVSENAYYYKVVVIGKLAGEETGRVDCYLINGKNKVADWMFVDLSALGEVDTILFEADSNDVNENGIVAPCYFAIDEIGFAK